MNSREEQSEKKISKRYFFYDNPHRMLNTLSFPVNPNSNFILAYVGDNINIFYVDANGHICSSWLKFDSPDGNWYNNNLNNPYGCRLDSPLAYGVVDEFPALFYITVDNRICYLLYQNGNWNSNFIETALPPRQTLNPNYDTVVTFAFVGGRSSLYYFGENNHLNVSFWQDNIWVSYPLNVPVQCSHYRSITFGVVDYLSSLFFTGDDNILYKGSFLKPWKFRKAYNGDLFPNYANYVSPIVFGTNQNAPENLFFVSRENWVCGVNLANQNVNYLGLTLVQPSSNILFSYADTVNAVYFVGQDSKIYAYLMQDDYDNNWRLAGPFLDDILVRFQSSMAFTTIVPPVPDGGISIPQPSLFFIDTNNNIWSVKA